MCVENTVVSVSVEKKDFYGKDRKAGNNSVQGTPRHLTGPES
jgi:hypothetical protein